MLPPTYAAARAALLDHARLVDAQERDLPGTELSFHEAGASPWRRGQLPLPLQGPGGPLVTVVAPLQPTQAARVGDRADPPGPDAASLGAAARRRRRRRATGAARRAGPRGADGARHGLAQRRAGRGGRRLRRVPDAGPSLARGVPPGRRPVAARLRARGRPRGGLPARRDRPGDGDVRQRRPADPARRRLDRRGHAGVRDRGRPSGRRLRAGARAGRGARSSRSGWPRGPGWTPSRSWPATGWCRPCPASRRPPRVPTATGSRSSASAWVNWDEVRTRLADRAPGRVSVVVPTFNDARMTRRRRGQPAGHHLGRRTSRSPSSTTARRWSWARS